MILTIGMPMARSAIVAIVFGAMLFVLGMLPSLIAAAIKEFQNFRALHPKRLRILYTLRTDLRRSGDVGSLFGGALVLILGLLTLFAVDISHHHFR